MIDDNLTPEWLTKLETQHTTTPLVTLEQIDYALGVLTNQAQILLKMFDDLRRQMLTQEQEKGNVDTE